MKTLLGSSRPMGVKPIFSRDSGRVRYISDGGHFGLFLAESYVYKIPVIRKYSSLACPLLVHFFVSNNALVELLLSHHIIPAWTAKNITNIVTVMKRVKILAYKPNEWSYMIIISCTEFLRNGMRFTTKIIIGA